MRYLNLLLSLFVFAPGLYAQGQTGEEQKSPLQSQPRGKNIISCSEYAAIKYNGYTIAQIAATDGENSQVQRLWGNYDSVETDDILGSNTYYFGSNYAHFYDSEITRIEIKSSDWNLTVIGRTVRIGDPFSELQQKLGSDLKIIYKPDINDNYAVSFTCNTIDAQGVLVYLSADTNEVVKISYYVST